MCTEEFGRSRVYPWVIKKPALVPNAFKRGCGLPRAYLAAKLDLRCTYIHTHTHTKALQLTSSGEPRGTNLDDAPFTCIAWGITHPNMMS